MLRTVEEVNALLTQGKRLHIAADAAVLARLARGDWIGGSIPYFLTEEGGKIDRTRAFVTELPPEVSGIGVEFIGPDELAALPGRAPRHGFTLIVAPAASAVHERYAVSAHDLPGMFASPVVGWVSGVHLDDLGRAQPVVVNGQTGEVATDRIVALRAEVAEGIKPRIGIINLFQQGSGDRFEFPDTGFAAQTCRINGVSASLYEYAKARQLDLRRPLVADLSGEMINVSFQSLDDADRVVRFYAPVLAGVEYRQGAPLEDYRAALLAKVAAHPVSPMFSCNCILNYLYADLGGDKALSITGPATFGEIAYVLLNQTLVYLELMH